MRPIEPRLLLVFKILRMPLLGRIWAQVMKCAKRSNSHPTVFVWWGLISCLGEKTMEVERITSSSRSSSSIVEVEGSKLIINLALNNLFDSASRQKVQSLKT